MRKIFLDNTINWYQRGADERSIIMDTSLSRRRFLTYLASGTALALGASGCSGSLQSTATSQPATVSPRSTPAAQTANAMIEGLVALQQFRGSVLVARQSQILLSKGYDWANVGDRIPNSPHTRFRIASITKQFTAMAILILQERGRLHVQDYLRSHLPNCPQTWDPITLQHLLTMTSGIPDYVNFPSYPTLMTEQPTTEQLIATFRDKPLDFVPGTKWAYSNSNYVLLGHIVQLASGLSWGEFLQRNIFDPLHLVNTGASSLPGASAQFAIGYSSWTHEAVFDRSDFGEGDGSMYSTVLDLYQWDQEVRSPHPTLVSKSTLQQMFTPYVHTVAGAGPQSEAYGYGWFIGYAGGRHEVEHTGEINGFLSSNQLYPDDGLTVIVLSNLDTDQGLRHFTTTLAGIFFGYADCSRYSGPCSEF